MMKAPLLTYLLTTYLGTLAQTCPVFPPILTTAAPARAQLAARRWRRPSRMLFADKRALETNLKVSLLAIREKELNFYTTNCLAVGTQSALLAGFAYSGLTQVAFPHEAPYLIKLLYLLVTTTAMGFELIAVMNTTLLSMVGPGLALRGHVPYGQSCPGCAGGPSGRPPL